ncbi:predicted protein [Naegleria gruberi]|uniref:Predicted protein n=1 Tax=Naegleria gruberi TaxID=5762 RepID=D2VHL8_NAEGR|nr:uncharacterized protein NAEGRDRAFT_68371 [Naegleria gruberi]EFC43610.1 predicted protein [Naegleria gruberi]|eukprot:XP_002676354.1 predicted protein [Naegleria gruberi strain NEG-M]
MFNQQRNNYMMGGGSGSGQIQPSYMYNDMISPSSSSMMRNNSPYMNSDPYYNPMSNRRGYYDNYMIGNEPLYHEDKLFDEDLLMYDRPTYRPSRMIANPDFGNFNYKKGYTAEVWLNDGETVVLSGDSRKKTYRTHYSPEYLRSFFFGWVGRLIRYLWMDRLFGLHVDTVKEVKTKNYIFVTAQLLSE